MHALFCLVLSIPGPIHPVTPFERGADPNPLLQTPADPKTPAKDAQTEPEKLPLPAKPTQTSPSQRLADALKEVINRGADLYNPPTSDHNGCYRLFQGALMVSRIHFDGQPELQKEIDTALAEAERQGSFSQRAFILRRALDRTRATLTAKPADSKRSEEKAEERKSGEPEK